MEKVAIYPGSFDPVTYGHLDIIKRATQIFDTIYVAVATNTHKKPLFTSKERVEMLKEATREMEGIVVEPFSGLVVDYAKEKKSKVLIRGLRVVSDFDYELQMAMTNRRLDDHIETLFLMPSEGFTFLSSSLIKEATALGADLSSFVPDFVARKIQEKLGPKAK
jgi:pantetheine-phosphate adenylyltransferase